MRGARLLLASFFVATGTWSASAQAQGACFFFRTNFQGQSMCMAPMQRIPSLSGAARNKLMSARIPNGLRVTICDNDNFNGSCMTLTESVPDFAAIGAAGRVASIVSDNGAPRGGAPQMAPQQGGYQPAPPQNGSVPPRPLPQQQGSDQPQPPPQQQGQPQPQEGGNQAPRGGNPNASSDGDRERRRQLRRECRRGDTNSCTELGRLVSQPRPRTNGGQRDD
jgi:hypothetical protein